MGASLLYQPVIGTDLGMGGRLLVPTLRKAFGDLPTVLDSNHIQRLIGIQAALSGEQAEVIDEILEAIHTHGAIRIWAEY